MLPDILKPVNVSGDRSIFFLANVLNPGRSLTLFPTQLDKAGTLPLTTEVRMQVHESTMYYIEIKLHVPVQYDRVQKS